MIEVLVCGMGRMGKLVVKRLSQEKDIGVVGAVDAPGNKELGSDLGTLAGIPALGVSLDSSANLGSLIKKTKPDVIVDFSTADACVANMKIAAKSGIDMVIGTTGLNGKQIGELKKAVKAGKVGAVVSPNMSVGVNVFWSILEKAAGMLKGYDVEIFEAHHKFKKDAPSGTALRAAEIVARAHGKSNKVFVYGREGLSPRKPDEIAIHAIRAGDIVGEHTVIFGTQGERVEITHRAHSREAFAEGVPGAVRFVRGKKGVFGMKDVLGI